MAGTLRCLVLTGLLLSAGCSISERAAMEKWKNEIVETERKFADMAAEQGVPAAFLKYAADDAVLLRNNELIIGKDAIRLYYEDQSAAFETIKLTWTPDHVEVASSGDLGYTYGHYTLSYPDSDGAVIEKHGIFHTVWKRQADGSWRFVWD